MPYKLKSQIKPFFMLFPIWVVTIWVAGFFRPGAQHQQHAVQQPRIRKGAARTAGEILQSEEFNIEVDRVMAEWHVPGIAISVVEGDQIHAEVRPDSGREWQFSLTCLMPIDVS